MLDKQLKDSKEKYKGIEIPSELDCIINQTLQNNIRILRRKKIMKRSIAASLVICSTLTFGLNVNQAFAESVSTIPVINQIAKVLTFREYTNSNETITETVSIPNVTIEDKDYGDAINAAIEEQMDISLKAAEINAAEYKEAYLETGGTEENYQPVKIDINYEVKGQSNELLSFIITKTESIAPAYNEFFYYNLNLETSKAFTLEDLFGPSYKSLLNLAVKEDIDKRKQEGHTFFDGDMGFTGITDEQQFYINNNNQAILVFPKYDIAPGSEGPQEFAIPIPQEK